MSPKKNLTLSSFAPCCMRGGNRRRLNNLNSHLGLIQPAPSSLIKLDEIGQAIADAKTVNQTKNVHDLIIGFEEIYRRRGATVEQLNPLLEKRLICERQAGKQLALIERAKPGPKKLEGMMPSNYRDALKALNLKDKKAQWWQIEALVPEEQFRQYIEETIIADKELTSAGLILIGKPIKALLTLPVELHDRVQKRALELEQKGTTRAKKRQSGQFLLKACREVKRELQAQETARKFQTYKFDKTYQVYNKSSENMAEITSDSVHMIISSPPYNNNARYEGYDDALPHGEYEAVLFRVLEQCYRILVNGGRIAWVMPVIISDKRFSIEVIPRLYKKAGFILRETIVWQKSDNQIPEGTAWGSWNSPSNPCLRAVTEFIFIAHKGKPMLKGNLATITPEEFKAWTKNLWLIPPIASSEHPAIFPQTLVDRLIKLYTFAGQTIVDPFCGIGTTGLSCKVNKRNFIGYEISEKYYKATLIRCLS